MYKSLIGDTFAAITKTAVEKCFFFFPFFLSLYKPLQLGILPRNTERREGGRNVFGEFFYYFYS